MNASASCRSILIVEDDADIRETLKYALELEGYEVTTAHNGRDGLEQLPKMAKPCLILLDLMMPVMNGWEFANALQDDMVLATIPVIVVTAFADRAGGIPAKGVIKKPIDIDLLFSTAHRYCGKNGKNGRSAQ